MNVCMILGYTRPEMLTIALEHVATNPDFKELYYLFVLDHGFRRTNLDVIKNWVKQHGVQHEVLQVPLKVRGLGKQSHAVFSGYERACEISTDLVYMLEDDIAVSDSFFRMTADLARLSFCAIGTESHNVKTPRGQLGEAYHASVYQSLGICWPKQNLLKILNEVTPAYYANPIGWLSKKYPRSSLLPTQAEQDGFIYKYIEAHKLNVGYFTQPIAFHFGAYGTHFTGRVTGTLAEKIAILKNHIYTEAGMRKLAKTEFAYSVSRPVQLNLNYKGEIWLR